MNSLHWIGCDVEMLLRTDNVHVLAVVDYLTEEGNILKWENSQVFLLNVVTKDKLGLEIEAALAEDGSHVGSVLKVGLNLLEDVYFGLCWGADDDYLGARDNIFGILWAFINFTNHFTFAFPSRFLSVSYYLFVPGVRASWEHIDPVFWVVMANHSDSSMTEVSTTANCHLKHWFHLILNDK